MFLTGNIFALGSAALIAIINPFYLLYFIVAYVSILLTLFLFYSGLYLWEKKIPEKKVDRRSNFEKNKI